MTSSAVEVRAGALASLSPAAWDDAPAFLVTDANVEPLVPRELAHLPRHVLPPGETAKSWDELGRVLLALDAAGLDRDGVVVALGGGVVTDIAGLAAALHRRGVAWWALPTSLVGQVDAAVGGKTAVNLGGGKNTVGAFHLPDRVLVDPRTLRTLPPRHLRAGLAEVLKTALLDGDDLFAAVARLAADDYAAATPAAVDVIRRCLARKLALVDGDLHDRGARQLLNLGHTFGHAIEAVAMPDILHGEAVGLGLLCAARFGAGTSHGPLESSLRTQLLEWGLPVTVDLPEERLLAELTRDKKRAAGRFVLIVPFAPGRVERVPDVPVEAVRVALGAALSRG